METPLADRISGRPRSLRLQFGHGGEAVETNAMSLVDPMPHPVLQFGHGGEAVETRDVPIRTSLWK